MSRRRKNRQPEFAQSTIESMSHNGSGVAHVNGKTVFVAGALPGEVVRFVYTRKRREVAEGRVEEVIQASPDRVTPGCAHYDRCGGCSFQHLDADKQIQAKQSIMIDQMKRIGKLEDFDVWPALTGPHWGYRHRARLGVKNVFKKGRVLVGFREKGSPYLAELDSCPVLHPRVGNHLLDLSDMIAGLSINQQLPQIEVAVGDDRVALVLRVLQEPSPEDRSALQAFSERMGFDLYLQSGGPDSIVPLEGECLEMSNSLSYALPESVQLRFGPSDFVQVNPAINRDMINRALEALQLNDGDQVLDLFCGLGNFSLPMARRAGRVTGIEGSESLVQRAAENARHNGLDNVEFYAANLMESVEDQPWVSQNYNKVLIDPPRTGAKEVLPLIRRWQPEQVLYISCNPSTLARDAGILVHELGYRLVRAGVMDMFPHTAHVESIALFEPRRKS